MLSRKNILLGVTGGIAAYKVPQLVREFRKAGATVRVVMTEASAQFVTPLTLAALSGNEVIVGMFPQPAGGTLKAGTWHVSLGRWAHAMLIAPATANVIAKLAHGEADNSVTTLALAIRCPLVVSPAMDADMWSHPATQENLTRLRERGTIVLPPEEGELASGLTGTGRLPGSGALVRAVDRALGHGEKDFRNRSVLVTAGPTREAIDPVRYIGNRSSGKMGFALAHAAAQRGAHVTLVTGSVHLPTPPGVKRIDVENAQEMDRAVMKNRKGKDAIIMAAAVADFTPVSPRRDKIKKGNDGRTALTIDLKPTRDILQTIGEENDGAVLVGFALETRNGMVNATRKLRQKHLDLIVLNNPTQPGAGFGSDTNIVTLIPRKGKPVRLKKMSKFEVAHAILDRVVKLL